MISMYFRQADVKLQDWMVDMEDKLLRFFITLSCLHQVMPNGAIYDLA